MQIGNTGQVRGVEGASKHPPPLTPFSSTHSPPEPASASLEMRPPALPARPLVPGSPVLRDSCSPGPLFPQPAHPALPGAQGLQRTGWVGPCPSEPLENGGHAGPASTRGQLPGSGMRPPGITRPGLRLCTGNTPELRFFSLFSDFIIARCLKQRTEERSQQGRTCSMPGPVPVQELGFRWHQEVALDTSDSSACPLGVWEHGAGPEPGVSLLATAPGAGMNPPNLRQPPGSSTRCSTLCSGQIWRHRRDPEVYFTRQWGDTNQDKTCTVTERTEVCPKGLRGSAVWAGHRCTRVR